MVAPIDFYFDFSSPYGYFGAAGIDDVAAKHGRAVAWKPVLLGFIMKETGSSPLASQPVKIDYAKRDWARLARMMKLPFVLPERFPIATQAAARAFWWVDDRDPALAKRFARAAYAAYFGEGRDIGPAEAVGDIAAAVGIDKTGLLAALQDPAVKDRLRAETDGALARGVCGSPYFIVDGEPFWGCDRFWMIRRWLDTGGW